MSLGGQHCAYSRSSALVGHTCAPLYLPAPCIAGEVLRCTWQWRGGVGGGEHVTYLVPGSLTSSISRPESRHLLLAPPLLVGLSHLTVVHQKHFHQNHGDHLLSDPLASRPSLPTRMSILNPVTRGILLKCE